MVSRLFLTVAIMLSPSVIHASVIQGPVVNPSNGHSYFLLSQNYWPGSEAEAQTLGGHLVTISDATELSWVFSTFNQPNGGRFTWIGLNDVSSEGHFVWAGGESVTYAHWSAGEPNDANGGEDYVVMYPPGFQGLDSQWNDINYTNNYSGTPIYGIAEVVPEPATLMILGIAGIAFFRRKT